MQSKQSLSNHRPHRGILLAALFLSATGVSIQLGFVGLGRAVQGVNKMSLSAQGPRPIATAVEILEARCGCVITYEDPRYVHISEIADVTGQVRRDLNKFRPGEAPKVFVPKGGAVSIEYEDLPTTKQPDGMAAIIGQLLEAHSAKGNAGRFRVELSGQINHVIPTAIKNEAGDLAPQESVLDTMITLPAGERSGMQTLETICAAISQANQTQVVVGTVPLNLFIQHRDRRGAASQRARDILVNLLEATKTGANLSWQLLYDPGQKMYALNIHQVPSKN